MIELGLHREVSVHCFYRFEYKNKSQDDVYRALLSSGLELQTNHEGHGGDDHLGFGLRVISPKGFNTMINNY